MNRFDELKRKVKDQIFCGIAKGEVKENMLRFEIGGASFLCNKLSEDSYIEHAINVLDKNWEEKHSTANRNAKPKAIFEYRVDDEDGDDIFEELKREAQRQIDSGIAGGQVNEDSLSVYFDMNFFVCYRESPIGVIANTLKRLKENHVKKVKKIKEGGAKLLARVKESDEIKELIEDRGSESYNDISDTASEIIKALGTDSEYTYFFSQIANKLARVKSGYSVEDSLLDIAGYAKLELDKYRGKNEG